MNSLSVALPFYWTSWKVIFMWSWTLQQNLQKQLSLFIFWFFFWNLIIYCCLAQKFDEWKLYIDCFTKLWKKISVLQNHKTSLLYIYRYTFCTNCGLTAISLSISLSFSSTWIAFCIYKWTETSCGNTCSCKCCKNHAILNSLKKKIQIVNDETRQLSEQM